MDVGMGRAVAGCRRAGSPWCETLWAARTSGYEQELRGASAIRNTILSKTLFLDLIKPFQEHQPRWVATLLPDVNTFPV